MASPFNESMGEKDFMQWCVPGGGDYREMLLTLPVTAPDSNASADPVVIVARADFDRKGPISDSVAFQAGLSKSDQRRFRADREQLITTFKQARKRANNSYQSTH